LRKRLTPTGKKSKTKSGVRPLWDYERSWTYFPKRLERVQSSMQKGHVTNHGMSFTYKIIDYEQKLIPHSKQERKKEKKKKNRGEKNLFSQTKD